MIRNRPPLPIAMAAVNCHTGIRVIPPSSTKALNGAPLLEDACDALHPPRAESGAQEGVASTAPHAVQRQAAGD